MTGNISPALPERVVFHPVSMCIQNGTPSFFVAYSQSRLENPVIVAEIKDCLKPMETKYPKAEGQIFAVYYAVHASETH